MAYSYSSAEILNTFTSSVQASTQWKAAVPLLTENDNAASVFAVIANNPGLANEFYAGLTTLVVPALIQDRVYNNHFNILKTGSLDGRTQESVSVDTKNPMVFDPNAGASVAYGDYTPEYIIQFHPLNIKLTYPASVNRAAFLGSLEAGDIVPFVTGILDQVVTKANYAEEQIFKQVIDQKAWLGQIAYVKGGADTIEESIAEINSVGMKMNFRRTDFNLLGAPTSTDPEDLVLIASADFVAAMNVNQLHVLAKTFNIDESLVMGRIVTVDDFGALDTEMLTEIFGQNGANDANYIEFTAAQKALLNGIEALLCDRRYIFYKEAYTEMAEQNNGASLKRNYFYHRFLYMGTEDAKNAALFGTATPSVTSVTVDPSSVTILTQGAKAHLTATVVTSGFAPQAVIWSSADPTKVTVDAYGNVTRVAAAAVTGTVVITATSVADPTKSDTCSVALSE